MPNIGVIKSRLEAYLKQNVPNESFEFKSVNNGSLGIRWLGASTEGVEIYQAGVKVAEVGILVKAITNIQKVGDTYAEVITRKGADGKYVPVYTPDTNKQNGDRLFSESKLAGIARGEPSSNESRVKSTGVFIRT